MKKSLVFLLCLSLISISSPVSTAAEFSDVRSGSELETMVNYLSEKNIISGYPDGSFQPTRTINRAEALKIIFETVQASVDDSDSSEQSFSDVDDNQWFAKYVSTAKKKSIIKGYADGTFKPAQEVNRAEFIKMAMTALPFFNTINRSSGKASQQFSDIDTQQWYVLYVDMALGMEFLRKTDRLKPTAPMQRQDAAEIIYAIANYLEKNPSSLSNDTYIPEESFVTSDPTSGKLHNNDPDDFGPDKLIVRTDGKSTTIQNKLHGYNLTLDGFIRASGNSRVSETTLHIKPDGSSCDLRIFVYDNTENLSLDAYLKKVYDPEENYVPPLDYSIKTIDDSQAFTIYEVTTNWKDQRLGKEGEYYILHQDDIFNLNSDYNPDNEAECDLLEKTAAENFEIR